jgi:acyl-CoA synthetase (AMP-forming)/AMP-acid ligase II/acyl carrier protein
MIEHASVLNLIQAQQKEFGITHKDRILLFSSICFDASVEQIFLALSNGAALVIADKDTLLDRDKFEAFIHAKSITHLHAVPSFLKNLSLKKPNHLKRVIAGGDDCSVELAKKFYKEYDFYNEYGPTETTVTSIQKHITHIDEGCANLAIGYPVYNTSCYLFDKHGNLVPPGAVGEIYLGGAGVARGYLNEPELTASKFIMDPFHNGGRLFKTGDYGKWHPASGITFLGRQDNQVKIRGFRIELEEIEKRIWDFEKKHAINHDSITDDKDGHITGENRITRCVKCLLPSNYKNITLDEKQVCSVCNAFDAYKDQAQKYFKNIDDLKQLFKEKNQTLKPEFDCMLLYSGGKDSTYVLYRLVELGYKVLALTFDNFFISDTAFENIKRNTAQLNVESMICQTEKMHEIFVESLTDDYTVCTGCFKALTAISTKIAAEKGIKIIVTGLSRGQIFDTKLMGLFQEGLYDVQEIENKLKLFRKLYHSVDDNISKLLDIRFSDHVFEELEFIDFFRYENVQPEQIKKYLITKDPEWSRPGDTGFCSTNCLINDAGIYIHHRATGYHNYAMPLSWDLRLGQKTPDAVRKELKIQWDRQKIAAILQEIGYFKKQIKDLKVLAVTDKNGEKKLAAYLVTEKSLKISKLRNHLLKELPDYMVPAYFVPLSSFPLTVNGKVDIKKLAAMQHEKTDPDNEYVPPRTRIESQLVDIWEQLLHIQKIGIYDNFFELGGNSLLATQVIWQIKETLNIEVHASELFKTPHISGLAELLEVSGSTIQSRPVIRKIDRDKYRKAEI